MIFEVNFGICNLGVYSIYRAPLEQVIMSEPRKSLGPPSLVLFIVQGNVAALSQHVFFFLLKNSFFAVSVTPSRKYQL